MKASPRSIFVRISEWALSVPVRVKIAGIMLIPVFVLGGVLTYWIRTGLSDWLSYLLSDARIQAAMRAGSRSVVFVTFLAAAFSILLTYALMHILTRPLLELRKTAQKVATGDLRSRSRVYAKDEIGAVASSINAMIDHLVEAQEELTWKNRRLEAMNRVAMAASLGLEIHEVLYRILLALLEVMEFDSGWVYLYDPQRDVFHLASWEGVPEALQPLLMHQPSEARCSCMQALVEGSLPARASLHVCERLEGAPGIQGEAAHVTLPIQAQEKVLGVLNFMCNPCKPIGPEDRELLHDLGSQISEIVANAWLQLKLSEKEQARRNLLSALVKAQEDERTRLAHELHDEAGQTLTSLLVRLKSLENRTHDEGKKLEISALCDSVSNTIEDVRGLSYQLRPPALEQFGLSTALSMLVEQAAQDAGLKIKHKCGIEGVKLPYEIETTLFRVAQEGLTNVMRHAMAKNVTVDLERVRDVLRMRIEDDGCGFDPEARDLRDRGPRLGLLGIQERVDILGGTFTLETAPGHGTVVEVVVPLPDDLIDDA